MYEVNTYAKNGDNFILGDMKIAKESLGVNTGETIAARSLVKIVDGKASAYTADDASSEVVPYGIAAADAENDLVVVYMTGEFAASKLALPEGLEAETVAPLLRSNGIFLKPLL